MPDERATVLPGTRLRLKCTTDECWVEGVEVTSRGGVLRHGPTCPHCQKSLSAQDDWPAAASLTQIAADETLFQAEIDRIRANNSRMGDENLQRSIGILKAIERRGYKNDPAFDRLKDMVRREILSLTDASCPGSEVK